MFWIGFGAGAGAGAAFVVAMVTVAVVSIAAFKGRSNKEMKDYWQESLDVQNRNADTFERIEELLGKR